MEKNNPKSGKQDIVSEFRNLLVKRKRSKNDIKTMALLGKYYAHKIAGSTKVALYREIKDLKFQNEAIDELEEALAYWRKFTEAGLQQNINPLWTNRVGHVDWEKTIQLAEYDIELAKKNP